MLLLLHKIGAASVLNSSVLPQKVNIKLSFDPTIPHLDIHTKGLETGVQTRKLYTEVHGNTTQNTQREKQSTCPSTNEWIEKRIGMHPDNAYMHHDGEP